MWRGLLALGLACSQPKPSATMPPRPPEITETKPVAVEPRTSCSIRLVAEGILVDGEWMKPEHAVAFCKTGGHAVVELGDTASTSGWEKLKNDLVAAGVSITLASKRGQDSCRTDNPLAKGCN